MADLPIPFSPPMIAALLDGRKTQTRRILKAVVPPAPVANCHPRHTQKHPVPYLDAYCSETKTSANPRGMSRNWCWWQVDDRQCLPTFRVPYVPGDRLWVREAYYQIGHWEVADTTNAQGRLKWRFVADDPTIVFVTPHSYRKGRHSKDPETSVWHKRLGRFMPRSASRLTLIIELIRVEQVQQISEADALAEGCFRGKATGRIFESSGSMRLGCFEWANARDWYADLWESLHGEDAWTANPWVAAVSFRLVKSNIDALDHASASLVEDAFNG
ncbi:hypothetical+protein [Methylocapsa aurea]|uniref:hypothetical protein n=1 Tax=Methylocapsa aurea TaxID=663610 RepID=UPI003D18947D